MSRIPLAYGSRILNLFRNQKNLGKMEDATVSAVAGSPACGDMIVIYLKINRDEVIEKASFESYGCAANIATASISTDMIKDMKVKDAWKISWKEVVQEIRGLPSVKLHGGILSVGAIRRAIREFYKMKSKKLSWLSEQLTFEEKQAVEEEELARTLSKKVKAKR